MVGEGVLDGEDEAVLVSEGVELAEEEAPFDLVGVGVIVGVGVGVEPVEGVGDGVGGGVYIVKKLL